MGIDRPFAGSCAARAEAGVPDAARPRPQLRGRLHRLPRGRITGYAVVDLRILGDYDWRLSEQNVWKVERMLLDYPHRAINSSDRRIDRLRKRYKAFKQQFPDRKPLYYKGRERWTELPPEFNRDRNRASAS